MYIYMYNIHIQGIKRIHILSSSETRHLRHTGDNNFRSLWLANIEKLSYVAVWSRSSNLLGAAAVCWGAAVHFTPMRSVAEVPGTAGIVGVVDRMPRPRTPVIGRDINTKDTRAI